MFQRDVRRTPVQAAASMAELVFHAAVRSVRKSHGNPVIGLLLNILQMAIMVAIFYLLLDLMGMRGVGLRGDFVLFLMSGVVVFMTHTKAMSAVSNCEGPTSPMMQHSPMNTMVSIGAAALSALYLQILSAGVILFLYHALVTPITIHDPSRAMAMVLLAWGLGVSEGMVAKAARPWWPEGIGIIVQVYTRANMIFSGKMFVANTLPAHMLVFFSWNPLFHVIDQTRGFVFLNYHPRNSDLIYPVWWALAFLMIGLMAEFYTRKHASASWGAGK